MLFSGSDQTSKSANNTVDKKKTVKKTVNKNKKTHTSSSFKPVWAWQVKKSFKETFQNDLMFTGQKEMSFTVECWLHANDWDKIKEFRFTTVNKSFILGVRKGRSGNVFYFDVPQAHSRRIYPMIPMRLSGGWVHLAGTYDTKQRRFACVLNGKYWAMRVIPGQLPVLSSKLFLLQGTTIDNAPLLVDEIRLTKRVIYPYKKNFQPKRTLKVAEGTVILLHLEKEPKFAVRDYADLSGKRIYRFLTGSWQKVDSLHFKMSRSYYAVLEEKLFKKCREKWPKEKFEEFKKQWAAASEEEKHAFLDQFWIKEQEEKKQ
ncbi:MAG: hypothetical protein D6820_03360 [Lentisphaerae bacterium]|nr:MAG: hypothetical protein D6820_03360 [Lentisphaerota bacterium]